MSLNASRSTAGGLGRRIAALREAACALWDQRYAPSARPIDSEYIDGLAGFTGWLEALHRHGAANEPRLAMALENAVAAAEAVVAAEAGAGPSQTERGALLNGLDRLDAALKESRHDGEDSSLIDE